MPVPEPPVPGTGGVVVGGAITGDDGPIMAGGVALIGGAGPIPGPPAGGVTPTAGAVAFTAGGVAFMAGGEAPVGGDTTGGGEAAMEGGVAPLGGDITGGEEPMGGEGGGEAPAFGGAAAMGGDIIGGDIMGGGIDGGDIMGGEGEEPERGGRANAGHLEVSMATLQSLGNLSALVTFTVGLAWSCVMAEHRQAGWLLLRFAIPAQQLELGEVSGPVT